MVHLEYKSLVTNEIINHYLSIIKDEKVKKDFINTISKFDIRISTKPLIEEEEFYYKIWIWRRGTKKRAHIKLYNKLENLKEEKLKPISPSVRNILTRIRVYADVPDDFEEYCEISFRDPSDEINRTVYPEHLKRANRFKKFITKEEIRSIPLLPFDDTDKNTKEDKGTNDFFDLDDESDLIPLSVIHLKDKREYDKLTELQNTLEYKLKIVESYGYDPYTGDVNEKKFPITKEDKQMKNIAKDFDNYFQALEEYNEYLKDLIKKYDIKPTGNLVQRLTFSIYTNDDINTNSKQQQDFDIKYIMVAVGLEDFPNPINK